MTGPLDRTAELPKVGEVAPDFELPAAGGGSIRLSGLRGRRVLLWISRGVY